VALGAMIAQGREAEVYAWDVGDDVVVKLYRPGFDGHVAEAAALGGLDGIGVAPRLLGTVRVGERVGLLLQRLDGPDMLTALQRQPWRLRRVAHAFAQSAVRIHQVQAPPTLPDLTEVLAERIAAADLDPRLRDRAARMLHTLPAGDRLCHGDLHPGNAVLTADGVSVIDWVAATRGSPAADFARTMLLLRRADPLPGTPMVFRMLLSAGRSLFAGAFARSYRDGAPDPPLDIDAWTVVHAAARLAEGITAERTRLISILEAAQPA
jgi:Phosphotransferase enzyme family